MVTVVIPCRRERWLQQTIDDLLMHAEGEVEIIVAMDGVVQEVNPDPKVKIYKHGTPFYTRGMREAINAGFSLARGDWLMKVDGHTSWDQGWDTKLIADCEDNWVVVPRRYRLDVEKWEVIDDGRPPIDYMYIDYPFFKPFDSTQGLHGAEWRKDGPEIDDLMTFQGSAYFMSKKWWQTLGDMDTALYGPFTHESQEISNKTWFMGGRVVVNKKTWYAHLHKGKTYGTGYGFTTSQWEKFKADMEFGRQACMNVWLWGDYDWGFLMDKFWPVPHWPDNWRETIITDRDKDWSKTGEGTWKRHKA